MVCALSGKSETHSVTVLYPGVGLSLGDFRAHGKVCIHVGIWTLTVDCPLVVKVCVGLSLGLTLELRQGWVLG